MVKSQAAFKSIVQRNSDLSLEELTECFSVVESEHDLKGNSIKSKFVWMAKGLDRILIEARDNLAWRAKPTATQSSVKNEETSTTPNAPDITLTPEQEQTRNELLAEVKVRRSALIAAEKAYLENSDDDYTSYSKGACNKLGFGYFKILI